MPEIDLDSIVRKRAVGTVTAGPGELIVTASDESTDRIGDVIRADGWELGNYRKNPIVLFDHDHARPVGLAKRVWRAGNSLMAHLALADPRDDSGEIVNPELAALRALVDQKILRATSVGFRPTVRPNPLTNKSGEVTGFEFVGQELLEISLVTVPAHPGALAATKGFKLSPEFRQRLFEWPTPAFGFPRRSMAVVDLTRLGGSSRLPKPKRKESNHV